MSGDLARLSDLFPSGEGRPGDRTDRRKLARYLGAPLPRDGATGREAPATPRREDG